MNGSLLKARYRPDPAPSPTPVAETPQVPRRKIHLKSSRFADAGFRYLTWGCALSVLAIVALIVCELFLRSTLSLHAFGWQFLVIQDWDPGKKNFGALPFIYGTVVSSLVAVLLAVPLSVGVATFTTELCPRRLRGVLSYMVELLAAIPSVIYGLWGIFVLVPFLRSHVQPLLADYIQPPLAKAAAFVWAGTCYLGVNRWPYLGATIKWTTDLFSQLFSGPQYGLGMLAAGIILAIMIIPIITSITREVMKAVPTQQREGVLALGATRWEMIRVGVLRNARTGILGAIILGLGRALGETMAVTMLIGNNQEIAKSLFASGSTLASQIANQFSEASEDLYLNALMELGLVLFVITLLVNVVAQLMVWSITRGNAQRATA